MEISTVMTPWQWERPDTPGERLKLLREHFGLSARAAAAVVGISDQSWRNYEGGDYLTPKAAIVIAVHFERDGDAARDLAQWLLSGGLMPKRPDPPHPFAVGRSARQLASPVGSSHNRCCMSVARAA